MEIRVLLTVTGIHDLIAEFIPYDFYQFLAALSDD
jgi:hypothetical protein